MNHNIETVKNLFPILRPAADYENSLRLLKLVSEMGLIVKSGLMIGFGETINQIKSTLESLQKSGCSIVTVGQYLLYYIQALII